MKSAWIWVIVVILIAGIGGLWWYAQSAPRTYDTMHMTPEEMQQMGSTSPSY